MRWFFCRPPVKGGVSEANGGLVLNFDPPTENQSHDSHSFMSSALRFAPFRSTVSAEG